MKNIRIAVDMLDRVSGPSNAIRGALSKLGQIKGLGEAGRDVERIGDAARKTEAPTESLTRAAKKLTDQTGALNTKIGLQERQLSILKAELEANKDKYQAGSLAAQKKQLAIDRLSAAIGDNKRRLETLNSELGQTKTAVNQAGDKMDDMAGQARKAGEGAERAGRGIKEAGDESDKSKRKVGDFTEKLGGLMAKAVVVGTIVANALTGIGDAARDGLGAGIRATMDYQDSLNYLQAVTGASADDMLRAAEAAKKLGADVTLPATSAGDAALAITELSKAGLSMDQALAAARGTLQLSAASLIEEADAANYVTDALLAFGLQGDQATQVADLLTGAANKTKAEIKDIGDAMKMVNAVAAQANLTLPQTTTAIALMAEKGIRGSDAGTSLKTMLIRLMAPSDDARQVMDELGISIYDAEGKMRSFPDIIDQFNKALALGTTTTKTFVKASEGNKEKQAELNAAIALQVRELNALQAKLAETAAKRGADSIEAISLEKRISALNAAIGKNNAALAEAGPSQGGWITNTKTMTEEQRNAYMQTIAGTDSIRAFNILLGAGSDKFLEYEQAISKAGSAQALAAARTAGLRGVIDGIKSQLETLAITVFTRVFPAFEGFGRGVSTAMGKVAEDVERFFNALEVFMKRYDGDIFKALRDSFAFVVPAEARGKINEILDVIEDMWNFVQANGPQIKVILEGVAVGLAAIAAVVGIAAIGAAIAALLNPITLIGVAVGALYTAWQTNFGGIREIVAGVIQFVQGLLSAAQGFIGEHKEEITSMGATWQRTAADVGAIINLIVTTISTMVANVSAFLNAHTAEVNQLITAGWNITLLTFQNITTLISGVVRAFLQLLNGDTAGAMETLRQTFATIWERVRLIFENAKTQFIIIMGLLWASLTESTRQKMLEVVQTIQNKFEEAVAFLKTLPARFFQIGVDMISGIISGIQSAPGRVAQALGNIVDGAINDIKRRLGIASPSRLLRVEVGRPIGQGTALGILDTIGAVKAAMAQIGAVVALDASGPRLLTGGLTDARLFGFAGTGTAAAAQAQGAQTINVTVNAQVNSETDMYRLAYTVAGIIKREARR